MFGRGLSGEFGWALLVVLTMGLSSRSMCSHQSLLPLFSCVWGEGKVRLGFGGGAVVLLDGGVFVVLGFVVVFAGGQFLFVLVVDELFWVGCVCGVEG